jgi:two-component sensor histidine kinase
MKADQHPNEAQRLADLQGYDILDTEAERDFDDIVTLAAQLCGTEASTITFIDATRQWFKAAIGMPGDPAPLENAICAHSIVADGFVEISDTLKDDRTKDNPGCFGVDGFRFYAAAQLISSNGLSIGTMCVLGKTAKQLSDVQRTTLQVLANQVVKLLELRKALKLAEILRKEVDHRVKNSLQLVVSLTTLQRRKSPNQEVKEALGQMQQRVMALANLHNAIQNSISGQSVNLRVLLQDLSALMNNSITGSVKILIDVVDTFVSAAVASSISVIVNEFVSNSVKHGFAAGQQGEIRFTGRTDLNGVLTLCCADDGTGSVAGSTKGSGIGIMAMRASAEQISANITVDAPPQGYQITLTCDLSRA